MNGTNLQEKISNAELNLQRKLEWMSRYDSKVFFIASVSIAMLGILATASGNLYCWNIQSYFSFGTTLLFLGISLVYIYYSQYPNVEAPNKSLLFFGTISRMKLDDFITAFKKESTEDYLNDLLHQIHVNSRILDKKFENLKRALCFIALSIIPWLISIYYSKLYLH